MATEPNLAAAAENAYKNLYVHFTGNNFAASLTAFAAASLLQFNNVQDPNMHPPANWCALLEAYAAGLPGPAVQITPVQLRQTVEYVFRFCHLVNYFNAQGVVTNAQAAAVLAAYNANF